jgi:hypothetical protein
LGVSFCVRRINIMGDDPPGKGSAGSGEGARERGVGSCSGRRVYGGPPRRRPPVCVAAPAAMTRTATHGNALHALDARTEIAPARSRPSGRFAAGHTFTFAFKRASQRQPAAARQVQPLKPTRHTQPVERGRAKSTSCPIQSRRLLSVLAFVPFSLAQSLSLSLYISHPLSPSSSSDSKEQTAMSQLTEENLKQMPVCTYHTSHRKAL